MGTRVSIVAEGGPERRLAPTSEAILREVERSEGLLSTWDSTTAMSRINAAPPGRSVQVCAELAGLLLEVDSLARITGRAFEPTVGPLVDAWGLRSDPRRPTEAELGAALAATGPAAFTIGPGSIVRRIPSAWIDSGGFGKGAALRAVARILERDTTTPPRVLVDLGGQLWLHAPGSEPWPVAVAHPLRRDHAVADLALFDVSVATSGASERPGHLLDPRTGRPASPWGSVTVVHADALEADVLSTALYVMGPDAGLAWAREHGVAALFLRTDGDDVTARFTDEMEPWITGLRLSSDAEPARSSQQIQPLSQ